MRSEDRIRILHILDACDTILRFIKGRRREDLDSDELLLFALVRATEIIGEAASRMTDDARTAEPEVPWAQMAGMRNRLVHAYFEVNSDILWKTATEDVPNLLSALAHVREHQ